MSRPYRQERGSKRRPRRQAANSHFFKYQLASDPKRAEESDLKRALQQSIEDQIKKDIKISNSSSKLKKVQAKQNNSSTAASATTATTPTTNNTSAPATTNANSKVKNCDKSRNVSNISLISRSPTPVKKEKKRPPLQTSWSLVGVPEEKFLLLRDEDQPRKLVCYPAIRHTDGDVIHVRDSVLVRSGARKTDEPFIARICAFWNDPVIGGVMMSLLWYYRPEHTEEGRKPHHLADEVFASRHKDMDSVECIEDKCYVLTFNEYCRYKKRCKMEQANTSWSLTDRIMPLLRETYSRKARIPDSDVNSELVFCCRQIYDSRHKKLIKNPLINPKYGHI